jgi:hypothetical protein
LRARLARLREKAGKGAVILEQRDGTRRYFSEMAVLREKFLAECDLIRGEPPKDSSGVIAAVLGATDRSRQEFEQRFGQVVGMEVRIVASQEQGGWVETFTLLADGTVKKLRYQGEEAERIRLEARCAAAPGSRGVSDLSE